MKKAVIDLGTNTFNLLIVDIDGDFFKVLHSEKEGVALGMGGINDQRISPAAIERAFNTMSRFKGICNQMGVETIKAIGTSAIRDAKNASELIDAVNEELGIQIEIVSGFREAELIHLGISASHDFLQHALIMDIGGGSTEFISADHTGILDLVSLNIGVSRIYQFFELSDPLSEMDVAKIEEWLHSKAGSFFDHRKETVLIGASGSFETFYELMHNDAFPEQCRSVEIPVSQLLDILDAIITSTQMERDRNEWIIPIRKKMAPIAAVKTRWVLKQLPVTKVFISPYSLKEGVIFEK
jgi:exopolyphosphatase/guanosine-5'-triphosphate,3'-diphosphate pyrophosphatase